MFSSLPTNGLIQEENSATEQTEEGMILQLADGTICAFNDSALSILGYTAERLKLSIFTSQQTIQPDGSPFTDETHPAIVTLKTGLPSKNAVMGFYQPSGDLVWLKLSSQPLFQAKAIAPYGVIITFIDITEQRQQHKQTQVDLAQTNNILQAVIAGTSDVIFVKDALGRYIIANNTAAMWLNTTVEAMLGKDDTALFPPDVAQQIMETDRHVISTGESISYEEEVPKHGEMRSLLSTKYPWYDAQGHPIGVIGISRDITSRKRSEQALQKALQGEQAARSLAETANRVKDEFLAVLSHELRTPLNPILGWVKLLKTGRLNAAKTAEALDVIERNVKLQAQLIEDLLDVSRILRGKLSLNVSTVDLASVITAAIETVSLAAQSKAIEIQTTFDPNIEPVAGDPARLQQIFWNLLSNAVKFTPNGGRVSVELSRVDNYAQITVSDTGKGINPDFLPHIFEYFRQEDASTTRKFGGLGLGLSIVRKLVELHGGMIEATSPGVGLGSIFTVRLPLISDRSESTFRDTQQDTSLDLSGIKVLVVDDEPDSKDFIAFALGLYGAEVSAASSALEVLQILPQLKPDVLVSDIGMPQMDGYELLQQIRTWTPDNGGQIPAIALTAYAREYNRKQALLAGFQMHLAKPIEPDILAKAIVKVMDDNNV